MQGKDPKMVVICWDASQLLTVFREIYPENNDFLCDSDHLIITTCIKKLILKYDGFRIEGKPHHQIYSDLKEFLKSNIDYLLTIKQAAIDECTKQDSYYVLEIKCPYQKLKSLFYTDQSHPGQSLICQTDPNNIPNKKPPNLSPLEVLRCPHVSVHIVFPNFEMFRQNVPVSQYKLIHFTPNYRPNVNQRNCKLKYNAPPAGKKEKFHSAFIIEYISQLLNTIQTSNTITGSKKNDMVTIFKEFKSDFSLCTNMIDIGTEYFNPLANQSYVRYLGQKRNQADCLLSHDNQIKIEALKSMRLQEIISPTIKFGLKKFNVQYSVDKNTKCKFRTVDDQFLKKLNWLVFACVMCDVRFRGFLAEYEMSQHVINQHGAEPDWFCPKCKKSFAATELSMKRWEHLCLK